MQEILDRLTDHFGESKIQLGMARDLVMKQKPSFFLVMIGIYIRVAASVIHIALVLLWKEKEKTCKP